MSTKKYLSIDITYYNKKSIFVTKTLFLVIVSLLLSEFLFAINDNLTVAESLANQELSKTNTASKNILSQVSLKNDSPSAENGSFYQDPTITNSEKEDTQYLILWLKLILIMGVFCLGAYLFLRYIKKKGIQQSQIDSHLFQKLLEFPIGLNKKIQIVKIINDYYVLASGQDDVVLLSKVEDKESIDILELESGKYQNKSLGLFEDSLKKHLNVGSWAPISMTKILKKKIKGL